MRLTRAIEIHPWPVSFSPTFTMPRLNNHSRVLQAEVDVRSSKQTEIANTGRGSNYPLILLMPVRATLPVHRRHASLLELLQ